MGKKELLLVLFVLMFNMISSQDLSRVGFVIMSQPHPRHLKIAEKTRDSLIEGLRSQGVELPTVYMAHKDLPILGAWTYFPLFPGITKQIGIALNLGTK